MASEAECIAAELKSCPLCGTQPEVQSSGPIEQVYCPNCGARNQWQPQAREHWNTRKPNRTLKPCPFCGGFATFIGYNDGKHSVQCQKCRFESGVVSTPEDAVAAWNRRISDE